MNTPHFLIRISETFIKIREATDKMPNDMDLGREVRKLIDEYKESQPNHIIKDKV